MVPDVVFKKFIYYIHIDVRQSKVFIWIFRSRYRKRRLEKEESVKKFTTSLKKFLTQKTLTQEQENLSTKEHSSEEAISNAENIFDKTNSQDSTIDQSIESTSVDSSSANHQEVILRDIGLWPEFVSDQMRLTLLELGPIQTKVFLFHLINKIGHFQQFIVTKNWAIMKKFQESGWYTQNLKKVYCFNCKLFGSKTHSPFSDCNGFNDWKHLSQALERHEKSKEHIKNVLSVITLNKSLKLYHIYIRLKS